MSRFAFLNPLGIVLLGAACSSSESTAPTPATSGAAETPSGGMVTQPAPPATAMVPAAGVESPGEAPAPLAPPEAVEPPSLEPGAAAGVGGQAGVAPEGEAVTDPGTEGDGNFTVSPPYVNSPDLGDRNAPEGRTFSFTLGPSQFYGGQHDVDVFIPEQYVDGTEAPFMISTDGLNDRLVTASRNLAVDPNPERRVPPLVVIGVTPGSDRSGEYDTVSSEFFEYMTTEVMPAVLAQDAITTAYPNFKLTSDPSGRGAYGCSSGAPAVMGMAWFGDFTRLLTYSGTFVALQRSDAYPNGAWDYPALIREEAVKPDLRIFLHVSQNDLGSGDAESTQRNWIIGNQNMAAALTEKGYHYRFVYSEGSGHCPGEVMGQTLPDALVWLWRGYTPN
jgi:enterochelin esterase family protein